MRHGFESAKKNTSDSMGMETVKYFNGFNQLKKLDNVSGNDLFQTALYWNQIHLNGIHSRLPITFLIPLVLLLQYMAGILVYIFFIFQSLNMR